MDKTTTLKTFNADMGRRRALAQALGHETPDYVWQLGVRWRGKKAGIEMAKKIESETARIWRRVPKETLRPDVWTQQDKG